MPRMSANGIQLYYEVHGEGRPLLFIHGLGSSTRDWENQVPEFSRNYQVITFDLRGHGQSDKPPGPYTIPQFASDAACLLQALAVGPAHIVGLSLGACTAFQLAIDFPELVKTLVIVNSGPAMSGDRQQDMQALEPRVQLVRQQGMRAMGEALSPLLFPSHEHASLRAAFVERWAENDPRAYIDATLSLAGWDVRDRLASIQCPTLVLTADQDYTPVAVKEAYAKLMPNARVVVIPDARHATPVERPQQFNAALTAFLAENANA